MDLRLIQTFFYFIGFLFLKMLTLGKYPNIKKYFENEPSLVFSNSMILSIVGMVVFSGFLTVCIYTVIL